MQIYCKKCKFDTGNREHIELVEQVMNKSGGLMEKIYYKGKFEGWAIRCPRCQTNENMIFKINCLMMPEVVLK
jgi:hypothetical protein